MTLTPSRSTSSNCLISSQAAAPFTTQISTPLLVTCSLLPWGWAIITLPCPPQNHISSSTFPFAQAMRPPPYASSTAHRPGVNTAWFSTIIYSRALSLPEKLFLEDNCEKVVLPLIWSGTLVH